VNRYSILVFLGTAVVFGQSKTTTYQRDMNGKQVGVSTSTVTADGEESREVQQTINGRTVPREVFSLKVLRTDKKGTLTESIIRQVDPSGVASGTERILTEETNEPDGKTIKETTFRSNVNGGPLLEDQRRSTEVHVSGDTTSTEVLLERPGTNRAFTVTERRQIVTKGSPENHSTTEIVLHPDQSGQFRIFQRKETTLATVNGETKSTTTLYELHGGSEPTLTSQLVSVLSKGPDGTEVTETNLYLPSATGRVQNAGARPELQEQTITQKRIGSDGSVTETVSARVPVSTDPGRLSAPQVISESVCQGKCVSGKPADPKESAKSAPVQPRQ